MKSILYLVNQRMPTEKAYGFQIVKMGEAWADLNFEVVLFFPYRINKIKESIFKFYGLENKFEAKKILSPDFYLPGRADWLAFQIKNFISALILVFHALFQKADIIYSRDELPLYFLSFLTKNIIYECHKFSKSRLFFYNRLKKKNLKFIVISQGIKNTFVKNGFDQNNILIASDGVDLLEFDIPEEKNNYRLKLNLPQSKKIIGYVGQPKTMGMEKGLVELIGSFKILRKQYDNLALVIVGGTKSDIADYESRIIGYEFKNDIQLVERKPHQLIPLYLKAFDVLTMPFPYNEHYAFFMSPLKLFEYMASKRPIVATDLPAVREILNEKNSILVNPDNSVSLAEAIIKVMKLPQLAKKLAGNAFEDVKSYTWQKRAKNILEFIK